MCKTKRNNIRYEPFLLHGTNFPPINSRFPWTPEKNAPDFPEDTGETVAGIMVEIKAKHSFRTKRSICGDRKGRL